MAIVYIIELIYFNVLEYRKKGIPHRAGMSENLLSQKRGIQFIYWSNSVCTVCAE